MIRKLEFVAWILIALNHVEGQWKQKKSYNRCKARVDCLFCGAWMNFLQLWKSRYFTDTSITVTKAPSHAKSQLNVRHLHNRQSAEVYLTTRGRFMYGNHIGTMGGLSCQHRLVSRGSKKYVKLNFSRLLQLRVLQSTNFQQFFIDGNRKIHWKFLLTWMEMSFHWCLLAWKPQKLWWWWNSTNKGHFKWWNQYADS
jgi:hypothetical protein